MKLFCFTYAGGNTSFYDSLEKLISPTLNVIKMEYSGHGTRHREKFYQDFSELATDMYEQLKKNYSDDEDYALFGYSMGSIAVVEVLKLIVNSLELKLPVHVFLSAHEPCSNRELADMVGTPTDEWVKERTLRFGAIPESLLNNNIFWRMYLPIYKADYTLIGNYDFNKLSLQSTVPTTVFYSETDTPYSNMKKWKGHFTGRCDFVRYEGSHFFIREHENAMADILLEKLKNYKD